MVSARPSADQLARPSLRLSGMLSDELPILRPPKPAKYRWLTKGVTPKRVPFGKLKSISYSLLCSWSAFFPKGERKVLELRRGGVRQQTATIDGLVQEENDKQKWFSIHLSAPAGNTNNTETAVQAQGANNFDYEQNHIDLFLFIRKLKLLKIHEIKRRKIPSIGESAEEVSEATGDMRSDNLLIEAITLIRELRELEENTMGTIDEEQVVARLELEGVQLDKEGSSSLKLKSRTVPAPCGDLIDQFSDR
ncbi:hypothetical protein NDU88_003451 [Pleurodeles waltl]|uniref:Uncharacterized protein n=1 Tax=Pleurodeles waltl TaxID=8319 RepID=A0AAV7T5C6_PLEWA|nr:hypothetical protein NDU88_003451 [Pleurodeles waltl]